MMIAREIVEYAERFQRESLDPFNPGDLSRLTALEGADEVIAGLSAGGFLQPAEVLRLSLQALRIQQQENAPKASMVEFVATLPPRFPESIRATRQVIQEMITQSRREVIILGYEFSDSALIADLARLADQGIDVILICDRARGSARRLLDLWPRECSRPRVFQDRERDDAAAYASMHAKCVLVDSSDLLITSANFTFHGLGGNIEMGVRLVGPAAGEARRVFSFLLEHGLVEELTG